MSTATPTHRVETIDIDRPGIPLTRLIKVEVRKTFDTRVRSLVQRIDPDHLRRSPSRLFAIFADEGFYDLQDMVGIAGGILGFFLPIVLIMTGHGRVGPAHRAGDLHARTTSLASRHRPSWSPGVLISSGACSFVAFGIAALGDWFRRRSSATAPCRGLSTPS